MTLLPYRDPAPSPTLMRLMGHVNRFAVLPRIVRVSALDLPAADLERLRSAVNPGTAAFLTPGHPEYLTDWMIDRELSRRVAPQLVSWAAQEIVNGSRLAQRFWLANGLIANTPRGGGKTYSLGRARAGHGVLLHPEGAVNWQAERIAPLHPGAIDMAMTLARVMEAEGDRRPVFVVPMVWRLRFTANAGVSLLKEMCHIERACGLSVWPSHHPAERLAMLLGSLLAQRAHRLGLPRAELAEGLAASQYFTAQALMLADIRVILSETYGPLADDPMHALRTVQRGMRRRTDMDPVATARDRALMTEFRRLSRIDPMLYGRATLTQEQIAELLKGTRAAVVTSGLFNTLHNNYLPRAVAPRIAHIRVADPLDIRAAVADGATAAALTDVLRSRLQGAQDALGHELERWVAPFRLPNPMAVE